MADQYREIVENPAEVLKRERRYALLQAAATISCSPSCERLWAGETEKIAVDRAMKMLAEIEGREK